MSKPADSSDGLERDNEKSPKIRADAQRSLEALLEAALAVFASSGVDAPVREIAAKANVGVGTLYRHFPTRADLIVAVFRQQVDACADAATKLAADHPPGEALRLWMQRYSDFIGTKRGLAKALHSGDSEYSALPDYFKLRLVPALGTLLDAAAKAGTIRRDADASELLRAVGNLRMAVHDDQDGFTRRMVDLLVDGLRYSASK